MCEFLQRAATVRERSREHHAGTAPLRSRLVTSPEKLTRSQDDVVSRFTPSELHAFATEKSLGGIRRWWGAVFDFSCVFRMFEVHQKMDALHLLVADALAEHLFGAADAGAARDV